MLPIFGLLLRTTEFAAIETLLRFADDAFNNSPMRFRTQYEGTVLGLFARAHHTAHGIVVLAEHWFGNLAMMANRSLFETMVSMYWMSLDPENRARRFAEFGDLEHAEFAALVTSLGWAKPSEIKHVPDAARLAQLRGLFATVRLGWTGEKPKPPYYYKRMGQLGEWPVKRQASDKRPYVNHAASVSYRQRSSARAAGGASASSAERSEYSDDGGVLAVGLALIATPGT